MNRKNALGLSVAILSAAVLILLTLGCEQRPKVGGPGYRDPMRDPTPYEPAEEFKYLVDLERATQRLEKEVEALEEAPDVPIGQSEVDVAMDALGFSFLEQENLLAEANERMVHARGEYRLTTGEDTFLKGLSKAGASEVSLPGCFPEGRWMGHFFVSHPSDLIELMFAAIDESMAEMSEQMAEEGAPFQFSLDMDTWARLYGLDSAAQAYEWMGDELVVFTLSNPDFDPTTTSDYSNMPSYSLLAVSSDSPKDALDVFENVVDSTYTLLGMADMLERTKIGDFPALLIQAPTFEGSPFAEMLTEEDLGRLAQVPPAVVLAMPDYVLMGDKPSVEAALDVFDSSAMGTGRKATIEWEINWDLVLEGFMPSNPGLYMSLVRESSPEMGDLMDRLYEATRDTEELGSSRATALVEDGEHFQLDVYTSRESIKLFESIQRVIDETPDETWEELGRRLGQALIQAQGGPMGGKDFQFEFDE